MPTFRLYDLTIHCKDTQFTIREVDPDRYSWFELIADLREAEIVNAPSNDGVNVKVSYHSPNGRIEVQTDHDLLVMFQLVGSPLVNMYVEVGGEAEIGPSQSSQLLDEGDAEQVQLLDLNEGEQFAQIGPSQISQVLDHSEEEHLQVLGDGEEEQFDAIDHGEEEELVELTDEDSEDPLYREDEDRLHDESGSSTDEEDLTGENTSSEEDPYMGRYESNNSSGCDDSDAATKKRKAKQGKIFEEKKGEKIVFEKGMRFKDVDHFRDVLREYVIQEGFTLIRDKNERKRVTAHCASIKCDWRIHASPSADGITFEVKTLNPKHDCAVVSKNSEANSTWIATKLVKRLRENPDLKIEAIKLELSRKYGIDAGWIQVYRARRKALEQIEGSHSLSYVKLPKYAAEIRRSNPGSVVKIQFDRLPGQVNPCFKRFFICLEAQKSGFLKGCRPFIGVDGCHLKGPYGGVLLAAVGLDGNEGLFPLACGVVEAETKDSWMFFLDHLRTSLEAAAESKEWTFMSDGQKGIEHAIRLNFPAAVQRRCGRHLYKNFSKTYPGIHLRVLFWAAVRANNYGEFNRVMGKMQLLSKPAHDWCMNIPLHLWARHRFSPAAKSDHVTNNLTESFNQWVGELRAKPIFTLVDGLRSKLMARIHKQYERASKWKGPLTKEARKRLDKIIEVSRRCSVLYAGGDEFEVMDGQTRHVVYLPRKTCSCGFWEVSGMPCSHATAAILYRRFDVETYCDNIFTKQAYLNSYSCIIHPILDESMWTSEVVGDPIQPPQLRRLTGRPKKNRRREQDEPEHGTSSQRKWHSIACKTCGAVGHNKRTCQRAPVKKRKTRVSDATAGSSVAATASPSTELVATVGSSVATTAGLSAAATASPSAELVAPKQSNFDAGPSDGDGHLKVDIFSA